MRSISTADLASSSYYDAPVFLDEGFILASPDIQVSEALVNRLQKWGYEQVYCDGTSVDAPSYEASAGGASLATALEQSIQERQQVDDARAFYREFFELSTAFFQTFATKGSLGMATLTEMLDLGEAGCSQLFAIQQESLNRD